MIIEIKAICVSISFVSYLIITQTSKDDNKTVFFNTRFNISVFLFETSIVQ